MNRVFQMCSKEDDSGDDDSHHHDLNIMLSHLKTNIGVVVRLAYIYTSPSLT
jgi:hypothetical protein